MMMQITLYILFICVLCPVLSLDPNWRLVFSDEFNGNTVDTNKWNVRDMKGNFGNGELQYYAPQQVSVFNGSLIITATNVSYGGMRYASGWVDTKNLFFTTYGRYEFRAQMPDGGQGMWPAIWLLSQELCWPLGAEFDIMEYRGFEPNVANGYYHYSSCCGCGVSSASANKRTNDNLALSFHVYALEWSPDSISWYVDGERTGFFEKKNLATGYTQFDPTPHYLIINSAMGGGYAGVPDSSTRYPNFMYIDYVRVYHYSETCEGNTCSNHGCCDPNSLICVCDSGWSGSSCEQWTGSFTNRFVSTNIQYTPATDEKVNGWDNGFSFYSDNNIAINNGLTLTLSTANCPLGCNGQAYSTGAWNSAKHSTYGTFTFIVQGPSVNGTGLSLQAAGRSENNLLEQISFVLFGTNRNFVQITTWSRNYQFNQGPLINLGFDASLGEHNYTFVWSPKNILFYIDGTLVRTATEVIPDVKLAMGVYYAAQPSWYGGSFVYNGPSTIKVSLASWKVAHTPGNCSAILPCQQATEGTGTGLTGDYYDGDTTTRFYTNYKLTRIDPTINFNWGTSSPDSVLSVDYFSIRWTGQIQAPYSALYTFYSRSDDGVRLYVNGSLLIDAWVVQSATERSGTITLNRGVKYDIVLEYQETGGDAVQSLSWSSTCHTKQIIPQSRLYSCRKETNGAGNGLTGRYYSDRNLGTLVATKIDSAINFNWGSNGPSALRNGQSDLFSISWTGFVLPRYSGTYTFYASSDDGSRLYINGQLLVNQWVDKSLSEFSGTINLVQGVKYSITYQYYENGGGAAAYLYWSSNCEAKQIVPQSQLFSS